MSARLPIVAKRRAARSRHRAALVLRWRRWAAREMPAAMAAARAYAVSYPTATDRYFALDG